ncbi:MAG: NAD-dependent epimerase/dehydratase family protein [Bacteroidetes bacterium]|nr:NAD-dependent epimerase/dehydratase family protein [Bacteroidota bacterium]
MKKFLIIGSKGFIGKNLINFLHNKGYDVWGADVIVDYQADESYFLIDTTNSDFHQIFEKTTFDICINCSGAASVPDSIKSPYRDFSLNTINIFKILESIRNYQPNCKFVNLSSAAVYGNPDKLPVMENSKTAPISPYGIHKKLSEIICKEFHQFFGLKTCSLRIFSAFGEGLKKQLFWDLYHKVVGNSTISLYGTGMESRDFIYIGDLINAILIVAEKAEFNGESLNVANGKEILIKDCVNIFYQLFETKINYSFSGHSRKGDPNNWAADISKLKELGYQPKYSLEEGLRNYYEWIRLIEKKLV